MLVFCKALFPLYASYHSSHYFLYVASSSLTHICCVVPNEEKSDGPTKAN